MKKINNLLPILSKIIELIKGSWIALCALSVFTTLVVVYMSNIMVKNTSDDKFCSSCHTMQPVVDAYRDSIHGGNNKVGFKAKCTECHLPHTGPIRYLVAKGITGVHDVFAQTFFNLDKIDWNQKRARRHEFTYDSGCLKCHQNFPKGMNAKAGAVIAHKAYLNEEKSNRSCVNCHINVGHHNLSEHLKRGQK